jgi:serine/threonine protein kinase
LDEETIFHRASQMPADDRAAFLDEVCAGDPALRQRIERLLLAHAEPAGFMEKPVADLGATSEFSPHAAAAQSATTDEPNPAANVALGTMIGPYKLLQELGEGGMGSVYLAEQEQPVRRRVALKVIKPGMDSAQVLARFEQERQALAVLDHPNIAKVLDAGTIDRSPLAPREVSSTTTDADSARRSPLAEREGYVGRPYFVMELVKGVPITKFCDQERLSPIERIDLFIPVCQAVQHAHQKGIIHRDLKPSNVLIALYDGRPVPKVIDFGVAKATGQRLTERTVFTEVGSIVGTLEYMAPEQAELNNLDIDTRADIYSLGVMLYELLTGSPPFTAKELRGAAFTEMLRIIREVEPAKPSTKLSSSEELPAIAAKRKLEPGPLTRLVHGDLDWIVMKCLEKERNRRYDSANQLAIELGRYLNHEPVDAGPPGVGYRLRKFVRRHRGPVVAAALLLLALVIGIIGTSWGFVRARAERDQKELARKGEAEQRAAAESHRNAAIEQQRRAEQQAAIAKAVNDFLREDLLRQADSRAQADARFEPNPKLTMREALDRASERIDDRFKDQPEVEAAIRRTIGEAYRGIGQPELGAPHLRRALDLLQGMLGKDHEDTLSVTMSLGDTLRLAGEVAESVSVLDEAANRARTAFGPTHRITLAAMRSHAVAVLESGQFAAALPMLEETLRLRREHLGANDLDTLVSMGDMAAGHRAMSRWKDTVPLRERSLDGLRERRGPTHPETLVAVNSLALAYQDVNRLPDAVKLYEESLAELRRTLGDDHPDTLMAQSNLGSAYLQALRYREGLDLLKDVLDRRIAALGPEHIATIDGMNNYAYGLDLVGRIAEAIEYYDQAVRANRALRGDDHPETLNSINNLALSYRKADRTADAIPLMEESLRARRAKLGDDHQYTVSSITALANAYSDSGRLAESLPLYEESVERRRRLRPTESFTLIAMLNLARARAKLGRPDDARTLFDETVQLWIKHYGEQNLYTLRAKWEYAMFLESVGAPDRAEPLLAEMLPASRVHRNALVETLPDALIAIGNNKLTLKKFAEADPLYRECTTILEKRDPGDWRRFDAMSGLGASLVGQRKFTDAEPLLLAAYAGLDQRKDNIPAEARRQLTATIERLVQLYEQLNQPEKAAEWRSRL